jgi:hypothetical protein
MIITTQKRSCPFTDDTRDDLAPPPPRFREQSPITEFEADENCETTHLAASPEICYGSVMFPFLLLSQSKYI